VLRTPDLRVSAAPVEAVVRRLETRPGMVAVVGLGSVVREVVFVVVLGFRAGVVVVLLRRLRLVDGGRAGVAVGVLFRRAMLTFRGCLSTSLGGQGWVAAGLDPSLRVPDFSGTADLARPLNVRLISKLSDPLTLVFRSVFSSCRNPITVQDVVFEDSGRSTCLQLCSAALLCRCSSN
jgi:hypothetical protein